MSKYDQAGVDEIDIDIFEADMPSINSNLRPEKKSRYRKPKSWIGIHPKQVRFKNAKKAAATIGADLLNGSNYYALLSGDFIFVDFMEAFIIDNDLRDLEISISTLSLDGEVIEALHNFSHRTKKLNLISSAYWYAHNNGMLSMVHERLDDGSTDFQFAIASSHTKDILVKFPDGKKLVITGSANLRSSACVEFVAFLFDDELFDFLSEHHGTIIDRYQTINKDVPLNKTKALRDREPWRNLVK